MPTVTKPSTMARRAKDRQRKRNELLDASEGIFLQKEYALATAEEIAQEAGVSVGTIYNFFQNKEGVYRELADRIARDLLRQCREVIAPVAVAEEAIEALVRLRLTHYERHRLFFQLFTYERSGGHSPFTLTAEDSVAVLYQEYLEFVGALFSRTHTELQIENSAPLHSALSLEGNINAFMAYWSHMGNEESLAHMAGHITKNLLYANLEAPETKKRKGRPRTRKNNREVYISRYDDKRLRELMAVARRFGREGEDPHLKELETALSRGKMVDLQDVPPDLVTMNSKVCLLDLKEKQELVRSLVFPVDARSEEEHISILEPLGTTMLGYRVGDVFTVSDDGNKRKYQVLDILYQPEAAGDYHL